MIPLFHPPDQDIDRMMAELRDTLSGRWWGQGPKVDLFEKRFGEKFRFPRCVMVNSGTAALHIAYRLAGVGPGTEVIVPVLTCTATCHPILHLGAKIVFADILPGTLTVDPEDVARKITKRTKAVVAVHLGGRVSEMNALRAICRPPKIALIEDAAQALGAGGGLGRGDFTCFSFQAIKHLSTGDGGMLVVRTAHEEKRARRLRWFDIDREQKIRKGWQAWDRRGITFDQTEPGYKYQPTDIDASIGLAALEDFDRNLEHRRGLVRVYRKRLSGMRCVSLLERGEADADWLFMVMANGNRDGFADWLRERGIETNVAHVRNDLFSVFGGGRKKLPGMDSVERQYLCLPLNSKVRLSDVWEICDAISAYEERNRD
jgi:dTDP-4-amino-4,6-dideoxygalactose transaminase